MKPSMAARIRALREQYREVFGEGTRSRHRSFLRKQIALRLQADGQGGAAG